MTDNSKKQQELAAIAEEFGTSLCGVCKSGPCASSTLMLEEIHRLRQENGELKLKNIRLGFDFMSYATLALQRQQDVELHRKDSETIEALRREVAEKEMAIETQYHTLDELESQLAAARQEVAELKAKLPCPVCGLGSDGEFCACDK